MTAAAAGGLVFTPEHEDLRHSVRGFLQQASPESAVREVMESPDGFDDKVWQRLTQELGVTALVVPEELGGAGYGFLELGVVLQEAGRALLVAPLLSTVLATAALLRSGDAQAQQQFLPQIAAGELRATVAVGAAGPSAGVPLTAFRDGDGWVLSGTASFVLDGHTAHLVLVPALTDQGLTLFAVQDPAAGLRRTALATVDMTRKLATLEFTNVTAAAVGEAGAAEPVLEYVRQVAAVALAMEQVGGAEQVLETTVEYAKVRNQFGRPIGSFQAVKHRCADMLVELESARSAAYHALACLAADSPDLPVAASMAKAFCSDAFLFCAGESIQLHGGIGFTWEHPAHLYFKRAKAGQLLFGDPAQHRQLLAAALGL